MQSLKIDGAAPEGDGQQSVNEVSSARPSSTVGSDAGFSRRPPEQRLEMPAQPLLTRRSRPERETDGKWRFLIIVAGAVIATAFAGQAMLGSFAAGGVNGFEWTAVGIFTANFFYLSVAALTCFAGAMILLTSPKPPPQS